MNQTICDHCGDRIKENSGGAAIISAPDASPRPSPKSSVSFLDYMGGVAARREERFDLCAECSLALLVALKARKAEIVKYGYVENPS